METRKEILTEDTVNCIDELMVEEKRSNDYRQKRKLSKTT